MEYTVWIELTMAVKVEADNEDQAVDMVQRMSLDTLLDKGRMSYIEVIEANAPDNLEDDYHGDNDSE